MIEKLKEITGLKIYEASLSEADGISYFLGRRGMEKLVGCVGKSCLPNVEKVGELEDKCVCLGPTDHANALAIRTALSWTAPKCLGLAISAGLGDRLGLATPGHLHAIKQQGQGVMPILAQQSIREMTRTKRTADEVMDCATWGVLQEGYRNGFGSDADHLQQLEDIDVTVAAGFTMFTIDPGMHVNDDADDMDSAALTENFNKLDFDALAITPGELKMMYSAKPFDLEGGGQIEFDEQTLLRAAVKYGNAIAHTVRMFRHLQEIAKGEFELEVSVDETESPTSPAEHYFFSSELKRLGVKWVSMAPRLIGRFEKGVDYIGDLDEFRASFAQHVAVMRTLGPYKMSIHSGSDKFSIYPIVAKLTGGLMHLKTAGTSYLEALRAISKIEPGLFREILDFARGRYETDRATYHVSADVSKVPSSENLSDDELPKLLDDFDAREVLHVTFGSVLTEENGGKFRNRLYAALIQDEDTHYATIASHLGRHVKPMSGTSVINCC